MRLTVKAHPGFTNICSTVAQLNSPFFLRKEKGRTVTWQKVGMDKYWSRMSEKQQTRALSVIEKRGQIISLLEQPLNETQIAGRLGVTHQRVRKYKQALMPERKKRMDLEPLRAGIITSAIAHPDWTMDRIGIECGRDGSTAATTLRKLGIKKPRCNTVFPHEREAREEWLRSMGISFHNARIKTSINSMRDRYIHMQIKYGYAVEEYSILKYDSKTIDAHIANLERHGIDWRSKENGLWRIICNSEEYVNSQMKMINSVGASNELHYLLLRKLTTKAKKYEDEKYTDLRNAVVTGDMGRLLTLAHAFARPGFCEPAEEKLYETAENAIIEVLSRCSRAGDNPAVFLAIAAVAIEIAIGKKMAEEQKTHRIDDFYETGLTLPTGEIEMRRQAMYG